MKSLYQAVAACAAAAFLLAGCSSGTPTATGSPAATGAPSASAVAASPTPAEKYVTKIGNCVDLPRSAPAAALRTNFGPKTLTGSIKGTKGKGLPW